MIRLEWNGIGDESRKLLRKLATIKGYLKIYV